MYVGVFELFKVGIGPSSSHTTGPMRAARAFASMLKAQGLLADTRRICVTLYGSLGDTGRGHGSDKAIFLGLEGETPESVDTLTIGNRIAAAKENNTINLLGEQVTPFSFGHDLLFRGGSLSSEHAKYAQHVNAMSFFSSAEDGSVLLKKYWFSLGGGFVVSEDELDTSASDSEGDVPHHFDSARELVGLCQLHDKPVSALMMENETRVHQCNKRQIGARVLAIWKVMQDCVERGYHNEGMLPGGLALKRRAPELYRKLSSRPELQLKDQLAILDWITLYALAVNEENAAGGRVVTAPTNGAAGIIPAVLHYYTRFVSEANESGVVKFFLTAAAIGSLYKKNASISGAEVGCQGEVGVACSMAAGALTEVLGGTPQQVENAAEIGMEHNLGLTCDPVGGLVQVPCIERNAIASIKAISAARLALQGDGIHVVTLDKVIKTMLETGADMHSRYKETSRGGLAINIVEC